MRRNTGSKIGSIAFIVGLVLAALIAIFTAQATPVWAVWLLAVLGLIVGLLNIGDYEVLLFLVASIAFIISFQALSMVITSLAFGWAAVGTFFALMVIFIAPATAIVAVKALFDLSRD